MEPIRNGSGDFAPTITDEALWELYESHAGSTKNVARESGLSLSQVKKRLAKIRNKMGAIHAGSIDHAGKFEAMVASIPTVGPAGARLSEASVRLYGIGAKDQLTQQIVTQGMESVGAKYRFEDSVPKFPVIQPANPSTFAYYTEAPTILRKIRRVAILSDAQIGFLLRDGEMVPTHDEQAIDVALQLVSDFAPDEMGSIGDWVDLPMFSRWPKTPEQVATTQSSIQAGHDIFGEFIAAAGPQCKKRVLVKGNHDDRFQLWARDHNVEAMNLRRASDTTGWPVFSTEFLLRFDELGVEVTAPYPQGLWWISDDLAAGHPPVKKLELQASYIHGHLHKLTRTPWAQTNRQGRVSFFMYDCGCLCKIDGTVPSDRARTDWCQGIVFVELLDGKIPIHRVDQIHIDNGSALWGGKLYQAATPPAADSPCSA